MKVDAWKILLVPLCLTACVSPGVARHQTVMDAGTAEKVEQIIQSNGILAGGSHGQAIARVSAAFLGTPYQAGTLIGGLDTPEALVADFNGVDCFTLADYIEALTRSHDQKTFLQNLASVRYVNGKVDYLERRHFFTDWFATAPSNARDITPGLSSESVAVTKQINRKADGSEYIPGLGVRARVINYIPAQAIDETVLSGLKTGDYVGIYSPLDGLDVSHVGVVIRRDGRVWFRNASSLAASYEVVDSPLMEYVRATPGIVVLRAG